MGKRTLNLCVAANVRRLRTGAGWSQEELAQRCEVHRTYIGSIERGERNVTLDTLERIARSLGVDPRTLLREPTK